MPGKTRQSHLPNVKAALLCGAPLSASKKKSLLALVDKALAQKVIHQRTAVGDYVCPRCGAAFISSPYGVEFDKTNYCGNCGQRLDWEECI